MEPLALAFGSFGAALYQHARGVDRTPVYPVRAVPAVEEARVLPEDSNDRDLLQRVLRDLCAGAARRLREGNQRAGRMELYVRYADHRDGCRKLDIAPPLPSSATLYARGLSALSLLLERRTRVRSMRLRLTALSTGSTQMELFADPVTERHAALERALDALRRRYGAEAVVHAA